MTHTHSGPSFLFYDSVIASYLCCHILSSWWFLWSVTASGITKNIQSLHLIKLLYNIIYMYTQQFHNVIIHIHDDRQFSVTHLNVCRPSAVIMYSRLYDCK